MPVTDDEIKLRFEYVSRDIGKLESAVNMLTATVNTLKPSRQWPGFITMLLIVVPLYVLVIDLVVRGK